MASKTRAEGYIGSKFVGIPAATGQPAAAAPSPVQAQLAQRVVGSQGKAAGEWSGSTYLGPQGAPAAPVAPDFAPGPAPVNAAPSVAQTTLPAPAAPVTAPAPLGAPRAVEGYNSQKLGDPTAQSNKYVAGRIMAAGGGVDQVLADPKFAGWTKLSNDKIRSPEGSVYDLSRDVEGANAAQYQYISGGPAGTRNDGIVGNDPNGGAQAAARAAGGGSNPLLHDGIKGNAAGGMQSMPGPLVNGTAGGGSFQDQTRALLMAQMQGLAKPISADDPTIQGEMQAQSRTLERNRQDRRAASAERMAAEGLNSGGAGSGALDQDIASGYEDKGAAQTSLQAQLFSRELTSRRASMAQLLQQALQTGDNESARALQMQMAQMDDQLRRMQLKQSASQWDDSYGLDVAEAERRRNLDATSAGAGQ